MHLDEGHFVRVVVPNSSAFDVWCVDLIEAPKLPVAIRGVGPGIPGDLMLAVRIFKSLHPPGPRTPGKISGAGTLSLDGKITSARGIRERVRAAERAGATLFLVSRDDYPIVADARKIKIVPVTTFAEAIAALERG